MMKPAKKPKGAAPSLPKSVKVRYVKSGYFRVVEADGIYGGITPQGLIQLGIFSERFPIPPEMELEVKPDGSIGNPIKKGSGGHPGIERELEISAILRPDTARALLKWLQGHLEKLDEIKKLKEGK
jgi:hypothetical protein